MKKSFTTIFLFLSIYALSSLNAYAKIDTVLVQDNTFTPNSLTICLGDTIRFVYDAGAVNTHNVHIAGPSSMDSISADLTAAGDVFEFTPLSDSIYAYQCDYHAGMMTGVFTVNDAPHVNLGPDLMECGDSVLLDAGNPGSIYVWSTGANTQTLTVSSSGNYWVVAYNSCGNNTSGINVTLFSSPPVVNLGADVTQCGGVLLNAGGDPALKYKYKWSPGGLTTSAIMVSSSSPSSKMYSVIVTDTVGCMGFDTVNVTITGNNPIFEGIESLTFPPAGWKLVNSDNAITWKRSTDAAKTGAGSMVIKNHEYTAIGQVDELISPLLCDLSASSQLTFQVAYQLFTNPNSSPNSSDTLIVQVSSDSGLTWTTKYKKYGSSGANQLTTAQPVFSEIPFVPTANQWRLETIALPAASKSFVKFINITGYENQLYIDDINISSGVGLDEINQDNYISVFPNPSAGEFTVKMDNAKWTMANGNASTIEIYNMYGEKVQSATMNAERVTINLSNLPGGIYLIEVQAENEKAITKIILNK